MERHVKILSILLVVYGVWILLSGYGSLLWGTLIGLFSGHPPGIHWRYHAPFAGFPGIMISHWIWTIMIGFLIGVPGIVAGIGLINRRNWARGLALLVGILLLFKFPFGTALGIYSLWVILKPETAELMTT